MTLSDREQWLPCSCAVPLVIFPTLARYTQQRGMHLELKSKKFEIGRFSQGQTRPPLTRSPYNLFPPTLFTKRKVGGGEVRSHFSLWLPWLGGSSSNAKAKCRGHALPLCIDYIILHLRPSRATLPPPPCVPREVECNHDQSQPRFNSAKRIDRNDSLNNERVFVNSASLVLPALSQRSKIRVQTKYRNSFSMIVSGPM